MLIPDEFNRKQFLNTGHVLKIYNENGVGQAGGKVSSFEWNPFNAKELLDKNHRILCHLFYCSSRAGRS